MTWEELDDLYAKFDNDHLEKNSPLRQKQKDAFNLLGLTLEYFQGNPDEFDLIARDSVGYALKYYQHNAFDLVFAHFDRIFADRKSFDIPSFKKSRFSKCTIENCIDTFQKIAINKH